MDDAHLRPERPIESAADDRLGRGEFVRRLASALISTDGSKARGVVVGIVGSWGSGKTSILNLLAANLAGRTPKPTVIRFDPWLVSGREDLILALLREMHAVLQEDSKTREAASKLLDAAAPYVAMLGRVSDAILPGSGKALDSLSQHAKERLEGPASLLALKKAVLHALATAPCPIVVVIDELDRLRDEEIRVVAQLVRAVADFPHVSYVLAYDQRRVEEALRSDLPGSPEERRERGRAYLEKLVHIPLDLPMAMKGEMRDLLGRELEGILAENKIDAAEMERERARWLLDLLVSDVFKTPRDVLRATGAYRVMLGMVGREVAPDDLLAFAALRTRFPNVHQAVSREPWKFVYQFDELRSAVFWVADMQAERNSGDDSAREDRLRRRFTDAGLDDGGRRLVEFLFPDLAPKNQAVPAPEPPSPDALKNWRALTTALRLGLPPGTVSRDEALRLFTADESAVATALAESAKRGMLPDLLERASELYPFVPDMAPAFWRAAARLFRRTRGPWSDVSNTLRDSGGMARMIDRRIEQAPQDGPAFLALIKVLIESGDAHIAPVWLQTHIVAYGMYGEQESDLQLTRCFLDEGTVTLLVEHQSTWVGEAFLTGDLFHELHHGLALHQVSLAGRWTDAHHARMRELAADADGIDQFAMVFFGGNVRTQRSDIARLISWDVVAPLLRARHDVLAGTGERPLVRAAIEKALS